MNPQYNAAFMAGGATRYEVQRTNNFRFVIEFSDWPEFTKEDGNLIELACDSVSLPDISNGVINLAYGNSDVKVAGSAEMGDVSLAVKDFIEPDVEGLLWKWRKRVYDPETGKVGWAINYKRDAKVVQYGPNGEVLRGWKLVGCWPTNLDLGEMSQDGSDKKSISMTISCDTAYIDRDSFNTSGYYGTGNR